MSDQTPRKSPGVTALGEGLLIAYEAIRANKIRASLTILGVAVGVSVVVAMAALITGFKTSMSAAFESAGPNNFLVTRFDFTAVRISDEGNNRPPWWNKPKLEAREAERLAMLPGISEALYNFGFSADFDFEGQRVRNVNANGYSSGWVRYTQGDFIAGRDFTPAEVRQNRALVVISDELAQELFGQRDPIGKRVRVGNVFRGTQEPFTVVGVFQPEPNIFTTLVKHFAVFPYTAARRRLRQSDWQAQILVVPEDSVSMADAQDEVIAAMRGIRGLGPRDENNFALLASAQILEMFNNFTAVIFLVMLALSSAGLLVGGVGVIGIMLISVTERTREIGIRKAVGATRREILWQFLVEASVLTALGAAAGMFLGWGLASIVATLTPLPARIPLWAVGTALAMAILTGMLFGLLPAYRASRLDPVAALRYE
ncbi:MAG TPA: ABC transporter permease [Longimicrobiales bacterium]|nr:ABC transporter permease [Longimicrobiales bacterium]